MNPKAIPILTESPAYVRATRHGETGKECAVCGKQTTEEHFVEFGDQGFFPVGPECFKRLAKAGYVVLSEKQLSER